MKKVQERNYLEMFLDCGYIFRSICLDTVGLTMQIWLDKLIFYNFGNKSSLLDTEYKYSRFYKAINTS